MALPVKLDAFEGPLDLLLHLIEKNKVDIYDIPIVLITDQYMAYIDAAKEESLDVMSEFLVMAATLLSIKSRMLLPTAPAIEGEEEEDPREELVQRLLEYKTFKLISYELRDRQIEASHAIYRKKNLPEEVAMYEEPVDVADIIGDLTLQRLNEVFHEVVRRQKSRRDPVRSRFGKIKKEEISLEDKMAQIKAYSITHRRFTFTQLFEDAFSRMEVIVTFLALLELMKDGTLAIVQEKIFDEIIIEQKAA